MHCKAWVYYNGIEDIASSEVQMNYAVMNKINLIQLTITKITIKTNLPTPISKSISSCIAVVTATASCSCSVVMLEMRVGSKIYSPEK